VKPGKPQRFRVFHCQMPGCRARKGESNHWFIAWIDKHGNLGASKFTPKGAHATSLVICGHQCLHKLLELWAAGKITALFRPECASAAVMQEDRLTAWVSAIYRARVRNQRSEARMVNYKDSGQEKFMYCFRPEVFELVEQTAGTHATFRTTRSGQYTNIMDVIEIDGAAVERRIA